MKRTITVLLVALAMMLSMTIYTDNAYSYTEQYSYITLKANTWTAFSEDVFDYTNDIRTRIVYKISAPSHGYITLNLENNDREFYVYDRYNTDEDYHQLYYGVGTTKSCKIAVDKGTYYIRMYSDSKSGAKVKYTFTSLKAYPNYCMAKARKLTSGKMVTVGMSKNNKYDRWYKIKLKSKKKITIWSSYGKAIHIYDSKYKAVDLEQAGTKSTKFTTKKQKKGTYYIRVDAFEYTDDHHTDQRPVITLKWK